MTPHTNITTFKVDPQCWMEPSWLVLDAETTGLDPRRHSMFQVSAINYLGNGIEITFRPRPGAEIDPTALAVTKTTPGKLDAIKLGYYDGIAELADWIRHYTPSRQKLMLCGINPASLDLPFMNEAMAALDWWQRPWFSHRTRDLAGCAIDYARAFDEPIPVGGFETDQIYALLNLDPEPRPHAAKAGVIYEARAFARIHEILQRITLSAREQI